MPAEAAAGRRWACCVWPSMGFGIWALGREAVPLSAVPAAVLSAEAAGENQVEQIVQPDCICHPPAVSTTFINTSQPRSLSGGADGSGFELLPREHTCRPGPADSAETDRTVLHHNSSSPPQRCSPASTPQPPASPRLINPGSVPPSAQPGPRPTNQRERGLIVLKRSLLITFSPSGTRKAAADAKPRSSRPPDGG
ncbi:hypothetical protein MHYP_G00252580 [Metynnis hypsauchen]